MHLLDTDRTILWFDKDPATQQIIKPIQSTGLAISVITHMEVWDGLLRKEPADLELAGRILDQFEMLEVTRSIAERCAHIRTQLRNAGRRTRPRSLALIIAATAIEHGLTLVTRNVDDYSDIPGIQLHNP